MLEVHLNTHTNVAWLTKEGVWSIEHVKAGLDGHFLFNDVVQPVAVAEALLGSDQRETGRLTTCPRPGSAVAQVDRIYPGRGNRRGTTCCSIASQADQLGQQEGSLEECGVLHITRR